MKTRSLMFQLTIPDRKRDWIWKPWFCRSQVVYREDGRAWLSPFYEIGWLCFVFWLTDYRYKRECNGTYNSIDHEYSTDLMQERINKLEKAIRAHKNIRQWDLSGDDDDYKLWDVLKD